MVSTIAGLRLYTSRPALAHQRLHCSWELGRTFTQGPSMDLCATPLHYAARHSASATDIELLVAAGADAEAQDDSGRTPLHYAAERNGNPLVFDALQEAGADVNARDNYGQTPLFDAASNSNSVAFEWLVAAGTGASEPDNEGSTLLHAAARGVDPAVIEHLLAAGADVNTRGPDNMTPLHEAAMWSGWEDGLHGPARERSTAVVEALLAAGADTEALYDDGWTALHLAARFNHNPAVVELLLAAGADVNARNKSGDTPLDLASSRTPLTIREVLRAHPLPPRPTAEDVEDVSVFRDCPMCPALLVVPSGRFRMGCVFEGNACWSKSNLPAHEVDVASFALAKFEVTRGEGDSGRVCSIRGGDGLQRLRWMSL